MIPVAKPYLSDEEAKAAQDVILSGWVTQGPKVAEFEDAFKSYVGADYACATSNCTTALHLALKIAGVRPGDVVVTVSHSFIASANAIRMCSAEPVFIDIDAASYNMSTSALKTFFDNECEVRKDGLYYKNVHQISSEETPFNFIEQHLGRVGAILAVHQMGMPCDIAQIKTFSDHFKIPLIEDAACAIGSEISFDDGRTFEKIGKPHGDIACFSFHPRKVMTTGEGGMITTHNSDFDQDVRLLRHQGMNMSDTERHNSKEVQFEQYVTTAYNYRMTDIQAAIGIEQIKKMPKIVEKRRQLVAAYRDKLKDVEHIELIEEPKYYRSNWQSYPIRIKPSSPVSRDAVMAALLKNEIATRRGIMNIHQEPPYLNSMWELPQSEQARDQSIILPLYYTLSTKGMDFIVEQLKLALS